VVNDGFSSLKDREMWSNNGFSSLKDCTCHRVKFHTLETKDSLGELWGFNRP